MVLKPGLISVTILLALGACTTNDMQGNNPVEYYKDHPIKSTIQMHSHTVSVRFAPGQTRLAPSEIDKLSDNLHKISMAAVDTIQISYARGEANSKARFEHLKKMLRNMGYARGNYLFEPLPTLKSGEMQMDVTYAVVSLPDCPDWRTSPTSTHANTYQGNFRCAQEVNLGLMVADPHDLIEGSGDDRLIDTQSSARAVQDFREGRSPGSSGGSPAGGGSAPIGASGEGAGQ